MRRCYAVLAGLLLLCTLLAEPASAQWGYPHAWSPLLADYGRSSPYVSGLVPTPPYFALHPPVYYSLPVPRTYGYSPFAYPPHVLTPEVVVPLEVENPHVPREGAPPAEPTGRTAAVGQLFINPFVEPPQTAQRP
jgi:hypothetical protein